MRIKIKPNSLKYISHNKRTHLLSDTSMPIHCKQNSLDTKDGVFVISRTIHCASHQAKGIKHVTNENFSYKASLSNQKLMIKIWAMHVSLMLSIRRVIWRQPFKMSKKNHVWWLSSQTSLVLVKWIKVSHMINNYWCPYIYNQSTRLQVKQITLSQSSF